MSPLHPDGPARSAVLVDGAALAGLPLKDLLQAFYDAAPFPVAICRRQDTQIVYCNAKLGELLGTGPSEIVGRRTIEFYHEPVEREQARRELESEGRIREREVRLRRPCGGVVWATFSIEPLSLEPVSSEPAVDGQELLLGTLSDVTGRREMAERLKESEARLRGLVENSRELVFALDRRATLTYLSPNVERLLGHAESQLLGKTFDVLAHGCDMAELWENAAHAPCETPHVAELRLRHKDGSVRWFCTAFRAVRDAHGQVCALTATARDITSEKAAADEVERMSACLREAQLHLARTEKMASLGLLMAGIAHEIRTPLGAVSNTQRTISQALDKLGERLNEAFPEALADSKLGRLLKVLTDSTRVVGDGSTRMIDIVQRLRKFSCADEAKLCAVDVNAIADDTLALIHHELKHYVAIQRCYGEGVTLMGYPARLNQVLVNLLINAAQAVRARGNGKITLETRAVGDHIEISISDDGVGIPPENLGNIFACGFTTRHDEGGSGLGLAISKEIIDAHHGSLEVKSEVGAGTTFTVRLPRSLSDCRKSSQRCRF
jgi:two-component system, NtrC family, sensor kinase